MGVLPILACPAFYKRVVLASSSQKLRQEKQKLQTYTLPKQLPEYERIILESSQLREIFKVILKIPATNIQNGKL